MGNTTSTSSLSVKTLGSLAFNSSLPDASDSDVAALSAVGVVGVVFVFMSMLLVNAAGVSTSSRLPPRRGYTPPSYRMARAQSSLLPTPSLAVRSPPPSSPDGVRPVVPRHRTGCSLTNLGIRTNLSKQLPPGLYARLEPALYPLVLLLGYFLPLAILVGLAGMLWPNEPFGCWVYGPGIILGGASMLLFLLGLGVWRARQWAVSGSVAAALALSAMLPLVAQLMTVLQLPYCAVECQDTEANRCTLKEFPYTAVTAISMSLNSLPVMAIVFLQLGMWPDAPAPRVRMRHVQRASMRTLRVAGDGPSFPMQQELPNIAKSLLVVLGFRRSKHRLPQLVALYGASLLILVIYSVAVYVAFTTFGIEELATTKRGSGLFASLTVVMLDLEVRPARGPACPRPSLSG